VGFKEESFGAMFLSWSSSLRIFYCCRSNTFPSFRFTTEISIRDTNYVSLHTLMPILTCATRTLDLDTYLPLEALMCGITVFACASLSAVCGFCDSLSCRRQSTTVCQHTRCRNPENGRSWINFRFSAIKAAVVSRRIVYPLTLHEIRSTLLISCTP
jgi:hypothetical protein